MRYLRSGLLMNRAVISVFELMKFVINYLLVNNDMLLNEYLLDASIV